MEDQNIAMKSINTIRTLTIDAVEEAQSGHMGMPLGSAPMAYVLWKKHLKINPKNANWFNRDRFVLSAGHGSMLLYSLLHVTGFNVSLNDLKEFRVIGSKTPGHPEFGFTDGVDVTTGPLGQGLATSVGLAIAEKRLAAIFNKEDYPIIDHYTYVICGDGDLMEGISYEALSLAGHLNLNKLIVLYDSNATTLDANLEDAFSEDIKGRFESMGWNHLLVEDGNDIDSIHQAIVEAKQHTDKPTIIEVKTTIGYGLSEVEGTSNAHSDPVGEEQVNKAKKYYQWSHDEPFFVPDEVYDDFKSIASDGTKKEADWTHLLKEYRKAYPDLYTDLQRMINKELPKDWDKRLPQYEVSSPPMATRVASHDALNALAEHMMELFGGAADLSSSTKVSIENAGGITSDDFSNRNIYFGVREFGMAAIANGLALHHFTPFVSTYFAFSDYMKAAIRLSALMELPIIYIFTHDSVAVGKDGPTHQPIEQLAAFRSMPNINVIRPADGNETIAAWKVALSEKTKPTVLVLGRQDQSILPESNKLAADGVNKGAYVISKASKEAQGILIATGSEVELAMEAQKLLEEEGIYVNVVSFPSWELFEQQSGEYQETIFPKKLTKRLTIEMGSKIGWREYAGDAGDVISIDDFGVSGDPNEVIEHFGFTPQTIAEKFKALL